MGMSRLLEELSKKAKVLYILFMKNNSTGYPERTNNAIEFLNLQNNDAFQKNLSLAVKCFYPGIYITHIYSGVIIRAEHL